MTLGGGMDDNKSTVDDVVDVMGGGMNLFVFFQAGGNKGQIMTSLLIIRVLGHMMWRSAIINRFMAGMAMATVRASKLEIFIL